MNEKNEKGRRPYAPPAVTSEPVARLPLVLMQTGGGGGFAGGDFRGGPPPQEEQEGA